MTHTTRHRMTSRAIRCGDGGYWGLFFANIVILIGCTLYLRQVAYRHGVSLMRHWCVIDVSSIILVGSPADRGCTRSNAVVESLQ